MGCSGSRAADAGRRGGGSGHGAAAGGGSAGASGQRGGHGLRVPEPWRANDAQTAAQLAQKRETFWGSQSSGSPTVWSNLRVAAEAILAGDVELAWTVLDAADIRVPGGNLVEAYDATGVRYSLPLWVYSSPSNLVSEAEMARLAAARHRDHVGPVTEVPVVCRMSASGAMLEQDVRLTLKSSTTVAELKARLHALLLSGEADQTPDPATPNARVNQWRGKGLPPARQRIMFRCAREVQNGCPPTLPLSHPPRPPLAAAASSKMPCTCRRATSRRGRSFRSSSSVSSNSVGKGCITPGRVGGARRRQTRASLLACCDSVLLEPGGPVAATGSRIHCNEVAVCIVNKAACPVRVCRNLRILL